MFYCKVNANNKLRILLMTLEMWPYYYIVLIGRSRQLLPQIRFVL